MIEMMVAMFVAMLIMSATYFLYVQSQTNYEKPRASYTVQEDLMQLSRWITRDLSETDLQSVMSYPNTQNSKEPPGLSFESARTLSTSQYGYEKLVMGSYGAVAWQKFVYYTLQPVDSQTGNLIRKEGQLSDQPSPMGGSYLIPVISPMVPSTGGMQQTERIIARNVILPNVTIPGIGTFDQWGGFKVTNDHDNTGQQVGLTGPPEYDQPIHVALAVREISTTTLKTTALTTLLIVEPRN